LFASFILSQTL